MLDRTAARAATVIALVALAVATLGGVPQGPNQAKPAAGEPELVRFPTGWQMSRSEMGPMFTEVAFSSDGRTIAFSASPDGSIPKGFLHVRQLDGSDATVVPGTAGVCMPTFSPDGQWIVFWSAPKILKVPLKGGTPVTVSEPAGGIPYGLAWAPDGRIIFGTETAGLQYVPAAGGAPATLTTIDTTREGSHRLPHMLPGGKALLLTSMVSPMGHATRIEWLSLDTAKRKVLVEDGADGRYLSTGHLVFVRKGALMAAPFDLARLEITGPIVTVVPRLMQALNAPMPLMNSGAGQYIVSESGALVWASGGAYPDRLSQLFWVDRRGKAEPWTALGSRSVGSVRVSPDGQRIAVTAAGYDRGVWVYDIQRKTLARSTPEDAQGVFFVPSWTPDGKRLVFGWLKTTHPTLWWMAADGTGKLEPLTASASYQRANGLTRDGKYVAFVEQGDQTGSDIKLLRMADRQVIPFAVTKAFEAFPEFSPDGRWLAYVSNESGRNEIYLRSFPDGKRTLQVSSQGGLSPLWAPDGRELFYWSLDFAKLMRAAISPGQNLSAAAPALLFEFNSIRSGWLRTFDITPDGQRFLIQKFQPAQAVPVTELRLVRRWFDEVRRLSPPAR